MDVGVVPAVLAFGCAVLHHGPIAAFDGRGIDGTRLRLRNVRAVAAVLAVGRFRRHPGAVPALLGGLDRTCVNDVDVGTVPAVLAFLRRVDDRRAVATARNDDRWTGRGLGDVRAARAVLAVGAARGHDGAVAAGFGAWWWVDWGRTATDDFPATVTGQCVIGANTGHDALSAVVGDGKPTHVGFAVRT